MKRGQLPLYAIALAVLVVGLGLAGEPLGTLLVLSLILVCPLMMFFMMRGMGHGGTSREDDQPAARQDPHDHHDANGK